MDFNIKYIFRELTPTGNETPMAIDILSSSDEEGSFVKYKRETIKRKIVDEDLEQPVELKKRLLNGDKSTSETDENQSTVFSDHSYCMPQQVYSPPPILDWETDMETTDNVIESQPIIINEQKILDIPPKKIKQPLAVRDSNTIENVADHVIVQKHRDNKVKTKYFNRRDGVQEATVLFEFLTKGIDVEDIHYLKQSYDLLLNNKTQQHYWMTETHWVSHPDILFIQY